jgi:hypothetical protein
LYNEGSTTGDFMSKHTPGPWKVKAGTNAVLAGRKQICSHVNAASALPVNMLEDQEIAQANARLIAAAPDLLEAMQALFGADMVYCMMGDGKDDQIEAIAKARAAIFKATGEQR